MKKATIPFWASFGALFLICFALSVKSYAQFAGGDGTLENPYQVENAQQFDEIRNFLDSHFVLMNDIDLNVAPFNQEEGWEPIGDRFEGSLDGNGFAIRNMMINKSGATYMALFKHIRNAKIRSLKLIDFNVFAQTKVAALAGYIESSSIYDVELSGIVNGERNEIGGLAGTISSSMIYQVHADLEVSGEYYVGALAGYMGSVSIRHASTSGSVSGNSYVGGFSGYYNAGNASGYSISDAISYASVQGKGENQRAIGGFLGKIQTGTIYHAISTGRVQSTAVNKGGFLGEYYTGTMVRCLWDAQQSGLTTSQGTEGSTFGLQSQELKNNIKMKDFDTGQVWNYNGPGGYPAIQRNQDAVVEYPEVPSLNGAGTANNPYLLRNPEDLLALASFPEAHFRLENNIDMTESIAWDYGKGFQVLKPENSGNRFMGVLDGNGFVIQNMTINRPSEPSGVAIFFKTDEAQIRNLRLEGVQVVGLSRSAGLIGSATNTVLEEVAVTGQVFSLQGYAGGVASSFSGGHVQDVMFGGYVYTQNYGGGLFGSLGIEATVRRAYSLGGVYWNQYNSSTSGTTMGGLVGHYNNGAYHSMVDVFSQAEVMGTDRIGGLVGYMQTGNISNSYSSGRIESEGGEDVGGFIGHYYTGYLHNCYWDVETSGISEAVIPFGERGLTTSQLQQPETFKNWDFANRWELKNAGRYPTFKAHAITQEPEPTPLSELQGSGSEADPYLIYSIADLRSINLAIDKHFRLMVDLDLSASEGWNYGLGWTPLALPTDPFTGSFDGNGHSITGLTISRMTDYNHALFARSDDAKFMNLYMYNVQVQGGTYVGSLVAQADGTTEMESIRVSAQVSGGGYVGGISGSLSEREGVIRNSETIGTVMGRTSVGALLGYGRGNIEECDAIGESRYILFDLHSNHGTQIGGLVGTVNGSMMYNTFARVEVEGTNRVGGLVGYMQTGSIYNSYASGSMEVHEAEQYGGLVGHNYVGNIYDSYYDTDRCGTGNNELGYARTHDEMKQTDRNYTYGAWNFNDVWAFDHGRINDDLPYLRKHEAQQVMLNLHAREGGEVQGGAPYRKGQMVIAQAIPNEGQQFEYWMEGSEVISTSPTLQLSLLENRTLTAYFGVLTDLDEQKDELPTKLELAQNYPNPFNPSTTIVVRLEQARNIQLNVYNLMGQRVQNIADGNYQAGEYHFQFQAQHLSSGIYFYQLKTEGAVLTRKMTLVK